ncbi:TMV resistance protein N-like [Helianthus annuus]|uniref:TMV resistance protein N-like n=1 Tax=Helianthus annuus TaxID=4232 RepID=UPI001652BA8E|nr:TMV resistance protein N-like [Helianthus annuus]
MAVAEASKELVWLKAFLKELGKNQADYPLYSDNESAVKLAKNPVYHGKTKHIGMRHESQLIKIIVDTVLDRLTVFISCVDEDLVGMTTRFQELQPLLDNRLGGVRMVGIWGVGGSGKSTLAYSLYKNISKQFDAHCILENIREKTSKYGLAKLQEIILGALSNTKENIQSVGEGKDKIKDMLCRMKVLLLLDDVSSVDQLEALAGKHSWFGSGSRILITTRDEHLLRTHKVGHIYLVKLLSDDEAIRLFKIHAYNEEVPVEDYETLSLRVVSYAAGLPLALKVLGSFLYDKNNSDEWIGTLKKLKEIPDHEVMNILKISYDGLETYQKELFLDIACFWNKKSQHDAVEILEACGYHPGIGIKVLKQKALISIVDGNFDMHDLVQEMGHYIVRGEGVHPYSPESYSRLWKEEDIRNLCLGDAIKENYKIEAIKYNGYLYDGGHDFSSRFFKIVSKLKKLRWLRVDMHARMFDGEPTFLNELCYADGYPTSSFLNSYPLMNLIILNLSWSTYQEVRKENDTINATTYKDFEPVVLEFPRLSLSTLRYLEMQDSTLTELGKGRWKRCVLLDSEVGSDDCFCS